MADPDMYENLQMNHLKKSSRCRDRPHSNKIFFSAISQNFETPPQIQDISGSDSVPQKYTCIMPFKYSNEMRFYSEGMLPANMYPCISNATICSWLENLAIFTAKTRPTISLQNIVKRS